jgi:hypothetical protein
MKKVLLSAAFSVFAIAASFAQFPCVDPSAEIKANNGGGNGCNGTITITLSFPAATAPAIVAMFDDDISTSVPIAGVTFTLVSFDGLRAEYCYKSDNKQLKLQKGGELNYRFVLQYANQAPGFCTDVQIPLPVKLQSFTAVRNSEKVNLTWITSSEDNNQGFELQRTLGNGKWSTVAFIFSQADGGNSTSTLTYQFRDNNNYSGISQYRLLQIDLDGAVKYSDIRSVRGQAQANKTLVFPNPGFNGTVNVIFEDGNAKRSVSLIDMSGRMIQQWQNFTDNSLQVHNLKPGMYNLRIFNTETGVQSVEKIMIVNSGSNN